MDTTTTQFSTFVDLLRDRAAKQPDRLAFGFLGDGENVTDRLTYGQLDERARTIAALLQSRYPPDERALLLYPPGLEFISAFFGCLYAGIIAVPTHPPRRDRALERWTRISTSCQAAIALTVSSLLPNIESQRSPLEYLATDNLDCTPGSDWQPPELSGNTIAFLQYTSGSTGMPKGAIVTHGNLWHNARIIEQCFQPTPNSKAVSWLPAYHDMGLIGSVLEPIYLGSPMYLMSPLAFLQKPWRWLQAISRYEANISGAPNFAYELCVRKIKPERLAELDLSGWELAFVGAEPVRAETLAGFTRTFSPCGFRPEAFYPCYGMAEATLMVAGGLKTAVPTICPTNPKALEQNWVERVDRPSQSDRHVVSVGRSRLDIKIVDPQSLAECLPDKVGEIWLSGASIVKGYWNLPQETQETFHTYLSDTGEGPFLRTGDLGFIADGELFVTGRLKDIIIIRGRNHYPHDIEQTVEQSHPGLKPSANAAFAVEVKGMERLIVVQEVERSYLRQLDSDRVVQHIRRAVADRHGLQVYDAVLVSIGSVPKTSSGKTRRRECREAFLSSRLQRVP